MTADDFSELVRKWFSAAGQAEGPLLPDGWFGGRRGENIYFLEKVDSLENSLVIHLSEDTTLQFDGLGRVFVENSDLVFGNFRQAKLRWKHYGGGNDAPYYELLYEEGQVRFAPPMGTTIKIP